MKKILLILFLFLTFIQSSSAIEGRFIVPNNRFKMSEYKVIGHNNIVRLIIDNKTNQEYLLYYSGHGVTSIKLDTKVK